MSLFGGSKKRAPKPRGIKPRHQNRDPPLQNYLSNNHKSPQGAKIPYAAMTRRPSLLPRGTPEGKTGCKNPNLGNGLGMLMKLPRRSKPSRAPWNAPTGGRTKKSLKRPGNWALQPFSSPRPETTMTFGTAGGGLFGVSRRWAKQAYQGKKGGTTIKGFKKKGAHGKELSKREKPGDQGQKENPIPQNLAPRRPSQRKRKKSSQKFEKGSSRACEREEPSGKGVRRGGLVR